MIKTNKINYKLCKNTKKNIKYNIKLKINI